MSDFKRIQHWPEMNSFYTSAMKQAGKWPSEQYMCKDEFGTDFWWCMHQGKYMDEIEGKPLTIHWKYAIDGPWYAISINNGRAFRQVLGPTETGRMGLPVLPPEYLRDVKFGRA